MNVQPKVKDQKIFSSPALKKKKVKKRTGPSIYSREYLEKKHGIKINGKNKNLSNENSFKKHSKSYFGFYSYLFIFFFLFFQL